MSMSKPTSGYETVAAVFVSLASRLSSHQGGFALLIAILRLALHEEQIYATCLDANTDVDDIPLTT